MKDKKLMSLFGNMLEKAPKLHTINHDYGFNFNHNTFMQKLINNKVVETPFYIHPDDYFKCLIAIDYCVNILFNNDNPIKNFEYIFEEMKEREKDFSLTAGIVAKELYLCARDKLNETPLEECIDKMKDRYQKRDIKFQKEGEPSVYYKIIGEMVCDLVSNKNKEYLKKIKSLNDLRALVFVDIMSSEYNKIKIIDSIKDKLKQGEFFEASVEWMQQIYKKIYERQEQEQWHKNIKKVTEIFKKDPTQTLATIITETNLNTDSIEKVLNFLLDKKLMVKKESCVDGVVYYLKKAWKDKHE